MALREELWPHLRQPQQPAEFLESPAHVWALNVGGSRQILDSAGTANGTFGVGSGSTTGNAWTNTRDGWCVVFDDAGTGTTASKTLTVGNSSGSGGPTGASFTYIGRVRFGSVSATQHIYTGGLSSASFRLASDNKLELLKAGFVSIGKSSGTLSAGVDYDIGVSYDGTTASFFIDGVASGTASSAQSFSHATQYQFGSYPIDSDRVANGFRLYRFAVFNRPLPADFFARYAGDGFWAMAEPRRIWVPVSAGGGSYTLTAEQGSYTLTGQAAGLLAGRVLAAAQGSYTLTGQAAALLKGNVLAAAQGAYALTGQDVGLLRGLLLSAAQGSYALSGQDATLTYTPLGAFSLTADQGSYTLTGQSASLLWGPVLAAGQGSYTLNGQDATLTYTPVGAYILTAGQGSYSLTGQDVLLQWGHVLAAAQGSYTLTGQDVSLARGLVMAAAQGSYTLSGQAAAFARTYVMSAGYGSYALTGQIVSLTYSGAALEALEYLLLISHITQSMSKTSKVTMEVDLISRIQQQLDGSSSI